MLAGNDSYLYYRIDRDTGAERGHWVGNELGWPLPAVNTRTGRVFFAVTAVRVRYEPGTLRGPVRADSLVGMVSVYDAEAAAPDP